jgi:hypothetical protein
MEAYSGWLGKGLCIDNGLENADTPGAGERKMSLTAVCRLDAAFTMYVAERGLSRNGLFSVATMLSSDGTLLPVFRVVYS